MLCDKSQVWFPPCPSPTSLPHIQTNPLLQPLCCFSRPCLCCQQDFPCLTPNSGCKDKTPDVWVCNRGQMWGTGVHQGDTKMVLGQGLALPGQLLWFFHRAHFLHPFSMWFMSSSNIPAPGTTGAPRGSSGHPSLCSLRPAAILCPLGCPGAWLSAALGARAAARGVQHPYAVQHPMLSSHTCTAPTPCAAPTRAQHQPCVQHPCTVLPLGVTCHKESELSSQLSTTCAAPAMGAGAPGMSQARGVWRDSRRVMWFNPASGL